MWDSLEAVSRLSDWAKIALIILGALTLGATIAAYLIGKRVSTLQTAANQTLQGRVDSAEKTVKEAEARRLEEERAKTIEEQHEEARRRTVPAVDAFLAFGSTTKELVVVIQAKNDIPFKYRWVVVTEQNHIVSGIQTDDQELHPATRQDKQWWTKADLDRSKIRNGYVELRFTYESLYSAELGYPKELRRTITHEYRLEGDQVFDWPKEEAR